MMICEEDLELLLDQIYEIFDVVPSKGIATSENGVVSRYARGEDLCDIVTDVIRVPTDEELEEFRECMDGIRARILYKPED